MDQPAGHPAAAPKKAESVRVFVDPAALAARQLQPGSGGGQTAAAAAPAVEVVVVPEAEAEPEEERELRLTRPDARARLHKVWEHNWEGMGSYCASHVFMGQPMSPSIVIVHQVEEDEHNRTDSAATTPKAHLSAPRPRATAQGHGPQVPRPPLRAPGRCTQSTCRQNSTPSTSFWTSTVPIRCWPKGLGRRGRR